ncbi:hypothetical protein EAI_09857, partial [Harpegnathos saltator]
KKKRMRVRKWIGRRLTSMEHRIIFSKNWRLEDPTACRKVLRFTREKFEQLLKKVHPLVQKKGTLV